MALVERVPLFVIETHEDIVLEILLRLPVKCLLKCLAVCKGWYSLIKSPRFIDLHLKQRSRTDYMIFSGRRLTDRKAFLSYSSMNRNSGALRQVPASPNFHAFPFPPDALLLCGPCNGIFCVVAKDWYAYKSEEPIFLCNPAAREFCRIPNHSLGNPPSQRHFYAEMPACGLGFDPRTNDYKVVFVLRYDDEGEDVVIGGGDDDDEEEEEDDDDGDESSIYHIGIYSLNSDLWREVTITLPATMRITQDSEKFYRSWYGNGLLANGHLHWMVHYTILCFDICNEVMRHIPLPDNMFTENIRAWEKELAVLDDCLALVVAEYPEVENNVTSCVSIWTVVDYGAKDPWMKRFSVCIPFNGRRLHPISIWNDDTLLLLNIINGDWLLISVRLGDDSQVRTQNIEMNGASIMLKESLVPLK